MKKSIAFAIFLILLGSAFVTASAQSPQIEPRVYRVVPPQQEKDDYRKNIDLVNELIRGGKATDALQVLDQMKGVYGETKDIHQLYKEAYLSAKQYDKVEQIIKADLAQSPDNWRLYTELGDLYFKSDRDEEARQNLNHAIDLLPEGPNVYREVANVYLANGLTSDAMDTFKHARMKLKDPNLFSIELAGLYEAMFDYKQAVDEYFLFMGSDSTKFNVVEDRVMRLIQTQEHLDQIEAALGERVRNNPKDLFSQRLYGDLLFGRKDLQGAFETYKKVDQLSNAGGGLILTFIHMCHSSGYFDEALTASQYLVSTKPSREVVVAAKIYIAYSQEGQQKYQDAIGTYQSIIDDYAAAFPLETSLSHYRIGDIELYDLKDPDQAYGHFQMIISSFRNAPQYPIALVRLGDCMMAEGDLDSAQALFERALGDPRSDPRQEELKYKLAELDFFRGNFEDALAGYGQLLDEFPKGLYINNSLERSIVINENQELDRPLLTKFARALLDNVEGHSDSAVTKLDELISAKSGKLSDLAQLEKAKIFRQDKKFNESLKAFNELLEKFPESLYRAQAQMLIGDVYNYDLHDRQKAIEAYEKLLKDYDRSVYVDDVRDKLRNLKAEVTPVSSG
jgi:tetratricopeptide (TPR) repeat protein